MIDVLCWKKLFLVREVMLLTSDRAVVSYWRKYVQEVLVNRLGGLSLPRKNVVRLTDRPDMTLDVYRGRKTTMQQLTSDQKLYRKLNYIFVCFRSLYLVLMTLITFWMKWRTSIKHCRQMAMLLQQTDLQCRYEVNMFIMKIEVF